jgi:hypothetical protein
LESGIYNLAGGVGGDVAGQHAIYISAGDFATSKVEELFV